MTAAVLAPADVQLLRLVAQGLTDGQIGRRLRITEGAARQRLYRLNKQLGTCTRIQAVAVAYRMGLLDEVAA
jgi:DNA-binding NarL/FixJ family response regulator